MSGDRAPLADCVHCGFCLPACPTYVLWGQEMDSPRGRIHLMAQRAGGAALTTTMVRHFDACLGCLACVPACPSGVRYDRLIEQTREDVEQHVRRPPGERLLRAGIFRVLPYPRRLRALIPLVRAYRRFGIRRALAASGLLSRLPAPLQAADALLGGAADIGHRRAPDSLPASIPAQGPERTSAALLTGCVQRAFFPSVNAATATVLAAEGCCVTVPQEQGCCGALSLHAGRREEARRFARRTIDVFERTGAAAIAVNAAGCGAAMKGYGDLLADDPGYAERARGIAARVRDFAELLVELGPAAPRGPMPRRVVYQDACHLRHAQGVVTQPRALLRSIPGLELREPADADLCCGSAGIYNVVQPDTARELGEAKARALAATGASVVVTSNPGCALQIRATFARLGIESSVLHLAEILSASMRRDAD